MTILLLSDSGYCSYLAGGFENFKPKNPTRENIVLALEGFTAQSDTPFNWGP